MLHSRTARQLGLEYRTDPAGPHPVTPDLAQELVTELDTRQEFLAPAASATARAGRPPSTAPHRTATASS